MTQFDDQLSLGMTAYSGELGKWWLSRAENTSHRYAYRKIARFIRGAFPHPPGLIVDYACGAGHLLSRLRAGFPGARLVGLDGSAQLLGLALRRLSRLGRQALSRTTLIETLLPDPRSPGMDADLVVYAFPNLLPLHGGWGKNLARRNLDAVDLDVSEYLAEVPDLADPSQPGHPEDRHLLLLHGRLVSLDLRRVLKRRGICIRVEYATVRRHELCKSDLVRVAFEEGSLDVDVGGRLPKQWFRVMASSSFRSRVIEDVYQHTGDERDRRGGYVITVLQAI